MNILPIALAVLWIQSPAVQPQTASVSGIVVEAGSGMPIANAKLQLTGPASPYSTTTDDGGNFALASLTPGSYTQLSAEAAGYVTGIYSGGGSSSSELRLAASQKMTGIRIELTRTGAIAGHILDAHGDPVPNVAVQALQYTFPNGEKSWKVVESRPTNDLGEFRLFWLKPGRYYIRAVQYDSLETAVNSDIRSVGLNEFLAVRPPSLIRRISDDGSIEDEATFPVYFPGTADRKLAVPIEVRSGESFDGADFRIAPIPVHRIRGQITGAPAEAGAVTVRLIPMGSSGTPDYFAIDASELQASIDANNNFEVTGVPSGSYELAAGLTTESIRWSGRLLVGIQNKDIFNVAIAMTPDIRVSGRFSGVENAADDTSFRVSADILLRSKVPNEAYVVGTIEGSALTFDDVPPGDYEIQATNLAARLPGIDAFQPAYIESVRAGDRDVLRNGLHVDSAPNETISIVLRTDFASLSGKVLGDLHRLAHGATIALVPDLRNQLGRYKTFVADASGQFHFEKVAPGGYRIFAGEDIEDGAWQNSEFLAAYESRGSAIQLTAGDNGTVDVPLITGSGQ